MSFDICDYTDSNGFVTTDMHREAIEDWRADRITTDQLRDVIEEWRDNDTPVSRCGGGGGVEIVDCSVSDDVVEVGESVVVSVVVENFSSLQNAATVEFVVGGAVASDVTSLAPGQREELSRTFTLESVGEYTPQTTLV